MTSTARTSTALAGSGRLLAAPSPDHRTHRQTYGPLPELTAAELRSQIRLAGLTGRGGAGFPTAIKLDAVAAAGGRAVVVANGAEGEPASAKDRQLLLHAPHLVLDGLQLAARAVGADTAFAHLRADTVPAIRRALTERDDAIAVRVVAAADSFISGQEAAVVSRLDSGPAAPRFSRVRVTERGIGGRPTLVQNVETLAHLALIARYGGAWFAALGAGESTGTFLATVHGPARVPGRDSGKVWEVPSGLPLRQLLESAGAGPVQRLQAVLVGGYHGTWLPLPAALDAPLSRSGLAPWGAGLGAGVIVPLNGTACGLDVTAGIVRYLAGQSAKQCGPCMFGLPHLAQLMTELAQGGDRQPPVAAIRQAAGLVDGRGACHHPNGTARLVRSALETFEPDVIAHGHGRCLARTRGTGETYGES